MNKQYVKGSTKIEKSLLDEVTWNSHVALLLPSRFWNMPHLFKEQR